MCVCVCVCVGRQFNTLISLTYIFLTYDIVWFQGIISDLNVTSPPRAPVTNIINEKEGNHSSETLELLSSDRNHMRKSW